MVRIRQQILQIAPVDVPVFIYGESGVGKEVVARMIHMRSTRRNQAFIKVNCAALPGELLESELFGYEQGAFTGAVRSKPGKFELANKGTIFLDEIAEMSPHLQAKLLHVLAGPSIFASWRPPSGGRRRARAGGDQRGSAGSDEVRALPRRPLLPSECAFDQCSAAARTNHGNSLAVPAFPGEVQREIWKDAADSFEALAGSGLRYPWPGNLRELENFVKRYVILEDDEGSFRELLEMAATRQRTSPREEAAPPREQGLKALVRGLKDEAEMEAIADALEKTQLVPQGCGENAGDQLQGAALQDAAIQLGHSADAAEFQPEPRKTRRRASSDRTTVEPEARA